jgi:hypothetical protein
VENNKESNPNVLFIEEWSKNERKKEMKEEKRRICCLCHYSCASLEINWFIFSIVHLLQISDYGARASCPSNM